MTDFAGVFLTGDCKSDGGWIFCPETDILGLTPPLSASALDVWKMNWCGIIGKHELTLPRLVIGKGVAEGVQQSNPEDRRQENPLSTNSQGVMQLSNRSGRTLTACSYFTNCNLGPVVAQPPHHLISRNNDTTKLWADTRLPRCRCPVPVPFRRPVASRETHGGGAKIILT